MAATVGDVPELGRVDVEHFARGRVFVAADWFAYDLVDVARPVDLAADQEGVHGRGRNA